MRFVLDKSGNFIGDLLDDIPDITLHWTDIRPPQPAYSPKLIDWVRNEETGECTGGHWVDPGAPTQAEQDAALFETAQVTLTAGVQKYLDTLARSRGYDGILSLCTYASSTNPTFSVEGQAGVTLRDSCWATGHQITADVLAGNRPIPTLSQVLDELPSVVWPA